MAYMIQQHHQQISTENLAYQKRISVADNAVGCKASSFFFPLFVFRSTDSTKSTVESVSDITTRTTRIHTSTFWQTWYWMMAHAPILPTSERRQRKHPFP